MLTCPGVNLMNAKGVLAGLACLFAMIGPPQVAIAQQSYLSLRDAIEKTLASNPRLSEFQFRQQSLAGQKLTAGLKPAPQLSTELENIGGTGELSGIQKTEFALTMSQVIELGGKRVARTNVAGRRQALENARKDVVALELAAETASRFIQLVATQQRAALLGSVATVARETLATTISRTEAGRAPEAEREQASARLRLAELEEQSAYSSINVLKVRLSSQWGELDPDFDLAEGDLYQIDETLPLDQLLDRLESNPALLVYADEARLRAAQLTVARSLQSANIQLGVGLRHLAELDDTALVVQASVPLFSRRRAEGAILSARANLALVESQRQQALLRLGSELTELELQRSQAVVELQALRQEVIPALQSALDMTRNAFESGRYSFLELSAAQQALLDARFRVIDTAERVHLLTNQMEYLSGQSVTDLQNEVSQ